MGRRTSLPVGGGRVVGGVGEAGDAVPNTELGTVDTLFI